jgi:hypothetical protein
VSGVCAHLSGRKLAPDIRPALAGGRADEASRYVGQPYIVRPAVAADRHGTAAAEIGAIDQQPANAGGSHLAEGDLLGGHAAIEARARRAGKRVPVRNSNIAKYLKLESKIVAGITGTGRMKRPSDMEVSPLGRHAADAIRRARKLPIGHARNNLRQLAIGLIWLDRNGLKANVRDRLDAMMKDQARD